MPNFYYKATDDRGRWVSGEVLEDSRDDAVARLVGEGLLVESLSEADLPRPPARSAASSGDLIELVEQLAALTRSGLPLPSGLRAAGREATSPGLRSTFFDLADQVESGVPLEEALTSRRRRFPEHLRGLVLAGARSGRLADVLSEYLRLANVGSELRRKFWWTLAYPLFALAVVVVMGGLVCSVSIKAVDSMVRFNSVYGPGNPQPVQAGAEVARFISDHGLEILTASSIVMFFGWALFRLALRPAVRRRVICSIPLIGPILRFMSLAVFTRLLAMLIEAETPLPLAFELAGSSVGDAEVADACDRMGREVEAGATLPDAIEAWDSMPAGLGLLFRWSEDRRNLPAALRLAGDMFESRARSQANFASSVLATMVLLLIVWCIGFTILTLYLPLIHTINILSG